MIGADLENRLPSRLHSKPARRLLPGVAVTWNVIDVEDVEPPFCTGFPLASVAEVIVVCVGRKTQLTSPVPAKEAPPVDVRVIC